MKEIDKFKILSDIWRQISLVKLSYSIEVFTVHIETDSDTDTEIFIRNKNTIPKIYSIRTNDGDVFYDRWNKDVNGKKFTADEIIEYIKNIVY